MLFSFIIKVSLPFCLALILAMSTFLNIANAQGFEDDPLFEDAEIGIGEFGNEFQDSDLGESRDFLESGMEGEEDPFAPMGEDDDIYIDEDSFDLDTEDALRDNLLGQRELLQREKQQSVANIGYGAGTGLIIGAWSAFITQTNTTRNQWRTVGTSTIIGGIIGMLIGTRSIWDPAAARPNIGSTDSNADWVVKHDIEGLKIAYSWKF